MTNAKPANIDEYIAGFPAETRNVLEQVRNTIKTAAPDAEEAISYGIPTFKLQNVNLVHFAGFQHHIGFYPAPTGMESFQAELSQYKTGKGSVQFPLDQPIPFDLITRIVLFRVQEQRHKDKRK